MLLKSKAALNEFVQGLIHFVYPPGCFHCNGPLFDAKHLLCNSCQPLLELIEPKERCSLCFCSLSSQRQSVCHSCSSISHVCNGVAAAFEYAGPAATLIKKLKYAHQPYLSEGMAAYLAAQFLRLKWPMPDVIIPIPITLTHLFQRGYNQSLLVAEELGKLLDRPVQKALYRKVGDFSQAGLSKKQRMQLKGDCFQLKDNQHLQDQCILLIDDVLTTGSTLKHCASALLKDCPGRIYGLTFCKSLE